MRFDDEVRANYVPKPEEKPQEASEQSIYTSAVEFVEFIKTCIMENTKNGIVKEVEEQGWFFSKTRKRVEYSISRGDKSEDSLQTPAVYRYYIEGEFAGYRLRINKNGKMMSCWWKKVDSLLKENGILLKAYEGPRYITPLYTFYVWLE